MKKIYFYASAGLVAAASLMTVASILHSAADLGRWLVRLEKEHKGE